MPAELALGTAQFGLKYGLAGRGAPVPACEVEEILQKAWQWGIRQIDTAPAYGDIEERLIHLSRGYRFSFVSKIPPIPGDLNEKHVAQFVKGCIRRSIERLCGQLETILFHRADDLLGANGDVAWRAAKEAVGQTGIRLGVSCYSPDEAAAIRSQVPVAVVQLPGNALDQRLSSLSGSIEVEIHLRSIFLQGLLLMSASQGTRRLPQAGEALKAWTTWCESHDLSRMQAAVAIAKGFGRARYCVIGVDRLSQLEEIVQAWRETVPLRAPALAVEDGEIIDPRLWRESANTVN